eukprot:TRINITY_DN7668_c0_g1_i1.p1 TRINITY_DN7668_c0_g1~~TRINITY_DN7668_c0_g1_i1.p1  ORF type:complete len:266 (-),score=23.95 TRINITY_DN7668_c0_g1_i1:225-968(-)
MVAVLVVTAGKPPCMASAGESCDLAAGTECLFGDFCTSQKKCVQTPVGDGEECGSNSHCSFPKRCRKATDTATIKTCTDPTDDGGNCKEDDECLPSSACRKTGGSSSGVCTPLYSLGEGEEVDNEELCKPWLSRDSNKKCNLGTITSCGSNILNSLRFAVFCTSTSKCHQLGDDSCLKYVKDQYDYNPYVANRAIAKMRSCLAGTPGFAAKSPETWQQWSPSAIAFFICWLLTLIACVVVGLMLVKS